MHLEKFYLDVVGPDGGGCIGYAARIDGLGMAVMAASTLAWDGEGTRAPVRRRTIRTPLPAATSEGTAWNCPALALSGRWIAGEPAVEEMTLWSNDEGSVSWQALAPRATVELKLGDRIFSGLGYAERIRLSLPPWKLPVDALRWGRFVSPAHSVVWIEWEHRTPRRWLLHNGLEAGGFSVDDTHLSWRGHRIAFEGTRVLRSGRLADTVFARWESLMRVLPRGVLALQETKWCSRGILSAPGSEPASGWVIHEHVRFR